MYFQYQDVFKIYLITFTLQCITSWFKKKKQMRLQVINVFVYFSLRSTSVLTFHKALSGRFFWQKNGNITVFPSYVHHCDSQTLLYSHYVKLKPAALILTSNWQLLNFSRSTFSLLTLQIFNLHSELFEIPIYPRIRKPDDFCRTYKWLMILFYIIWSPYLIM